MPDGQVINYSRNLSSAYHPAISHKIGDDYYDPNGPHSNLGPPVSALVNFPFFCWASLFDYLFHSLVIIRIFGYFTLSTLAARV